MITKYHYNVHVIPTTPGTDATIWVGVTINEKYVSDDNFVTRDSVLWNAAIARARELWPSLGDCFCEEWNDGEPVYSYTRITEEQRAFAQRLWNEYNATLAENGLKLHYDVDNGCFFVASTDLENGMLRDGKGATPDDLDADELERVVNDGGFDSNAVNNPPWFVDFNYYTLKVKRA